MEKETDIEAVRGFVRDLSETWNSLDNLLLIGKPQNAWEVLEKCKPGQIVQSMKNYIRDNGPTTLYVADINQPEGIAKFHNMELEGYD